MDTADCGLGRRELWALIDQLPHPLWVRERDGAWLLVNRAFEAAFGGHAPGARIHEWLRPPDPSACRGDGSHACDLTIALDGVEVVWQLVSWPLRDAQGEPFARAGLATDITRQRQAQRQLHELHVRPPAG